MKSDAAESAHSIRQEATVFLLFAVISKCWTRTRFLGKDNSKIVWMLFSVLESGTWRQWSATTSKETTWTAAIMWTETNIVTTTIEVQCTTCTNMELVEIMEAQDHFTTIFKGSLNITWCILSSQREGIESFPLKSNYCLTWYFNCFLRSSFSQQI